MNKFIVYANFIVLKVREIKLLRVLLILELWEVFDYIIDYLFK